MLRSAEKGTPATTLLVPSAASAHQELRLYWTIMATWNAEVRSVMICYSIEYLKVMFLYCACSSGY